MKARHARIGSTSTKPSSTSSPSRSEVLKHGVSVQTQLLTALPAVDGDRIQLQQVILKLILMRSRR